MPSVDFSDAELQALHDAYTAAAQVDDRARQRIIDEAVEHAENTPQIEAKHRPAFVGGMPRASLE